LPFKTDRALSANSKPAARYSFATYMPDVPLDPATMRSDVKIIGSFYNRNVLAHMR
jgi:hypothetical protein